MNIFTNWFIKLHNTENVIICETIAISTKHLRTYPELWRKKMSKYQNLQTKYPDMQYKKQLQALCLSEKPLYKASNGMLWIKTNIN